MLDKDKSTKGSNIPTKKILKLKPMKPKPKVQNGLETIFGFPKVLLIAPHGVMGDDDRTDIIAFEARQQLECYAIINRKVKREKFNLNSFKSAVNHSTFIKKLIIAVHNPNFKLIVWIHGGDENGRKWEGAVEANEFDCEPEAINAFIGYGQGAHPTRPKEERNDRFTAKEETVVALCKHLTEAGMVSVKTGKGSTSYRGRHHDNMNQWLIENEKNFSLGNPESIQIEIRKEGFRDSDENARKTATIITQALTKLFPDMAQKRDANVAEKAYKELSDRFKRHITALVLDSGQYIINTFYGGNARRALAKNKSQDNPPSLNLLIKRLKKDKSGNTPSVSWFYKAVNLAAHEAIGQQMGLSTFTILGHSQKLLLLNVPQLKQIERNKFDKAIEPAFKIKERLAKHSHDNNLTVRDFKEYIDKEYPPDKQIQFDLGDLSSNDVLLEQDQKVLISLWNKATKKIERSQESIGINGKALNTLERILAEKGKVPIEGKGRFRDWTEPENNYNICRGCSNDCLYCYAKPGINFRCKVEKGKWHQMEIVAEKVQQPQGLKNGLVGFPSTHDIVPGEMLDAYLTVLGKFLRAGNEVLIVTKPRMDCIKTICYAADPFFKDKILFRFTIGAMDNDILRFWEPHAPTYQERKDCLQYAFEKGFRTSVSMEPLLAMNQVDEMIAELRSYVSQDIWIGTMNHLKKMKRDADKVLKDRIDLLEKEQSSEELKALYGVYKYDTLIQWKTDALKAIHGGEETGEKLQKCISADDTLLAASTTAEAVVAEQN